MSIFKNLFGSKGKTVTQEPQMIVSPETTVLEPQQVTIPPADLFVDNEAPQQKQQTVAETHNRISAFLNRNFHSMGVNDGFEYHSHDTLETGKKRIRAEFQLIVDQSIQEKATRRLHLKNLIVDVEKISDDARKKLENTIEEINSTLSILQNQKELSVENEGWVMNAIHSYHQGFLQGLNDWLAGEQLLNSINNI